MGLTDFQDCQAIIRAFEKGCAYSTDDRSVFAMITPYLQDVMLMADSTYRFDQSMKGVIKDIDKELTEESEAAKKTLAGRNVSKKLIEKINSLSPIGPPDDISYDMTDAQGNTEVNGLGDASAAMTTEEAAARLVAGGANSLIPPQARMAAANKIAKEEENKYSPLDKFKNAKDFGTYSWEQLKKCKPCEWSKIKEEFQNFDWKGEFNKVFKDMKDVLKKWWDSVGARLSDFMEMFSADAYEKYIDLCAFLKFLFEWVCLPDLYKILGALSALLLDICTFLDGFGLDMIFGLLFPLFLPSLQGLIDVLEKFLLICLKPLDCIIDAIMQAMAKLDLSSFSLPTNITVSLPDIGRGFYKDPIGPTIQAKDINVGIPSLKLPYPTSSSLTSEDSFGFDEAKTSFRFTGEWSQGDMRLKKEFGPIPEAPDWLKTAANSSKIASQWMGRFKSYVHSFFEEIVYFMRRCIDMIESAIKTLLDEFKRFIEEYILGWNINVGRGQMQKLAIMRLISLIITIIRLFKEKPKCEKEGEGEEGQKKEGITMPMVEVVKQIVGALNTTPEDKDNISKNSAPYTVWQDEDGDIHLEESSQVLSSAINILNNSDYKSIFNTGDAIIDANLANIVEKITTPVKVVFRCPANISPVDIDKVNNWISNGA